jgi:2'-hydroxyisoflavone reductase
MQILILGGTVFLGRALVEAALDRGHAVTLFNRGRTNADLFPEAERLQGDRDGGLDALRGRRWDAVIDTSGYVPRVVHDSAALLADATDHYTFISSISVYAEDAAPPLDESSPVATLADPSVEEVTGETYGGLKALCEQAVQQVCGERALVIRPGLIVGPHDPTDRFAYWPRRIARGGEVLAPDIRRQPVQVIDARDLAAWILALVEQHRGGTFNATGPAQPTSFADVLESCRTTLNPDARITWIDPAFLLDRGVQPWSELPLWEPAEADSPPRLMTVSIERALDSGLAFRPLAATIRDTHAWESSGDPIIRHSLRPEREAELLAAWHARDS